MLQVQKNLGVMQYDRICKPANYFLKFPMQKLYHPLSINLYSNTVEKDFPRSGEIMKTLKVGFYFCNKNLTGTSPINTLNGDNCGKIKFNFYPMRDIFDNAIVTGSFRCLAARQKPL